MNSSPLQNSFRAMRRWIIGLTGFTLLGVGIALTVLPGPAFLVIPMGLGLLATEFVWAKRTLARLKEKKEQLKSKWQSDKKQPLPPLVRSL